MTPPSLGAGGQTGAIRSYELLRRRALGASLPAVHGAAMLERNGIAGWMASRSDEGAPDPIRAQRSHPLCPVPIGRELDSDIVRSLAEMTLIVGTNGAAPP